MRTIKDFFKPFSQPRINQINTTEPVVQNATIVASKEQDDPVDSPSSPPSLPFVSSTTSPVYARKHTGSAAIEPALTSPIPSSPPTLIPRSPDKFARRVVRELSPLSSLESLSSPEPEPEPVVVARSPAAPAARIQDAAPAMVDSNSSSSLSNLPISSQSSSKRIVRGNMFAVTNSDSDSIDADSDPLDDIDELIRRKRMKMTPPTSKPETVQPSSPAGRELRSSTRRVKPPVTTKTNMAPPPRKVYKHSLASLVASKAKEDATNQKIAQYQVEYQHDVEECARYKIELDQTNNIDAEAFAERLQPDEDDEETKARFIQAIKRNDILVKDVHYHFFRKASSSVPPQDGFPAQATSRQDWTGLLKDAESREEAFRSGFAADMARVSALPEEIIDWLSNQVLLESDAEMASGFACTLENSFKKNLFLTSGMRRQFLQRAGREDLEPDLFSDMKSAPPLAHQRAQVEEIPINLEWMCFFLNRTAERLPLAERRSWLSLLVLALMDPKVDQNTGLQTALQECIISLLEADLSSSMLTATIEHVGQHVLGHMANPVLVQRLLRLLPSYTSSCHIFKRRLGMASFMKNKSYLSYELDATSMMADVTSYLHNNNKFKIKENVDFSMLGARFVILDISVGAGFSDFAFYDHEDAAKADSPVSADNATPRPPPSKGENEFNSAVDQLVEELRRIAFNIRDSGATHMKRTECKTAIEKLSYRLEYSTRTRPKIKTGIFGGPLGASEVMDKFVSVTDGHGVQDTNMGQVNSSEGF